MKVNCYSGQTYAERPRSFLWQGVEYEVREIEKAWLERGKGILKFVPGITNCSNSAIMRQNSGGHQASSFNWSGLKGRGIINSPTRRASDEVSNDEGNS